MSVCIMRPLLARPIPNCSYCLGDDHAASACPSNPSIPLLWDIPVWPTPTALGQASRPVQAEACRNYNDGRCKKFNCRYQHICISGVPGSSCLDQLPSQAVPAHGAQESLPSEACHAWLSPRVTHSLPLPIPTWTEPSCCKLFNHLKGCCSSSIMEFY